jgi:hypothetical protein
MTRSNVAFSCLFALLCLQSLSAQTGQLFNRPPAGAEESLKERVGKFFALQEDGKFRAAEGLVCADSKDAYYDAEKRQWKQVDIGTVTFEENFQKAKVLVTVITDFNYHGTKAAVKVPLASLWKMEEGTWCNYIPKMENFETPFGVMSGKREDGKTGDKPKPVSAGAVMGGVTVSSKTMRLYIARSSDQVTITNGLPGQVDLKVQVPEVPGLTSKLEPTSLSAGQSAVLRLDYNPPSAAPTQPVTLLILIDPLGRKIPIRVLFADDQK